MTHFSLLVAFAGHLQPIHEAEDLVVAPKRTTEVLLLEALVALNLVSLRLGSTAIH